MKFTPISFNVSAANCPICGAYANFDWGMLQLSRRNRVNMDTTFYAGYCAHCYNLAIWKRLYDEEQRLEDFKMIYPYSGAIPLPNDDLPVDIKNDYLEASVIVDLSPRGAVALLRLAVQKLCKHLGEKGEHINADIKSLVSKGLNPMIQKALDAVRVTGNSAVHPGTIDLNDNWIYLNKLTPQN
ncbi:DUF4145 domain-containing protein [Sphingobacterium thalpophilum]|uniref:DUF4145 domain-containing protein n=1 Tax=Sphingobacterium thalpophilum TaxID=259 RepID=UPI003D99FB41